MGGKKKWVEKREGKGKGKKDCKQTNKCLAPASMRNILRSSPIHRWLSNLDNRVFGSEWGS